ncbi:MAG: GlcNAc-PI de-N-acetylase [endosymbiont of Galathealinum brachiosum]|uniref:GlcNAc-PI de-N-acetylase n=1 Tax=endosymbiont of Galathealinum brachiosum TaxID=2200906 RepID=A0A370D9F8_9GAMM|nr:MAG: GlcNAc-PI de-N-acetylase [endosymbiont of Galathealinum brachiosum]
MNDKVLVLAVHPDDETLGCGGALLKHKLEGDNIHWLICTSLNATDENYDKREEEISKVSKEYGFSSTHNLRLDTMRVDEYSVSDLVGKISEVIQKIQPTIIYLPFKSDVHSDHRAIFSAAYSCTKSFRYPYIKKIYMMETLSETEFSPSTKEDAYIPNVFVDITDHIEKKLEIMKLYEGEVGEHPFPRSIRGLKALSTLRGSTAGCEYAESFVLLKEIR